MPDRGELLTKLFLKGYQWPFDVRKVAGGSSIIDILVYMESAKGRRVYLDYRRNPFDGEVDFETLSPRGTCLPAKCGGVLWPAH